MLRPLRFGFNSETASTNAFQSDSAHGDIATEALHEFDTAVIRMQQEGIDILVLEENLKGDTPDAVFPNNWVSLHHSGLMVIYPMQHNSRRCERRPEELMELLDSGGYQVTEVLDLTGYEKKGQFLEGTGSVVFDHQSKTAYAARSSRTHEQPLLELCEKLKYEPFLLDTAGPGGQPVYHTNVVLSIGRGFAMVSTGIIQDKIQSHELMHRLERTGRTLIETDSSQMGAFCCNVLEVTNRNNDPYVLLSETALGALTAIQRKKLESLATLIPVQIPTIEKTGGGSIRCMLAEVFLPEKSKISGFRISTTESNADLEKIFDLRWRVLREPWNQPVGTERDDYEEHSVHFAAYVKNSEIIGTGRLQKNTREQGQIRFMAIDPRYQGKGAGTMLVQAMEQHASRLGLSEIILHSRENAIKFYESLGYKVKEKSYLLFDSIQHFLMEKKIDS